MDEYLRAILTSFFESVINWNARNREEALDNINALSNLLVKNQIYLRDYSHLESRDPQKEAALAEEWKRVGTLFHSAFPELSNLCEYKSNYWIRPNLYSAKKVAELGITIRNLESQLMEAKRRLL